MNMHDRVSRASDPLCSQVDGELVIFSPLRGMYYGSRVVGNRIWSLIEDDTSISSICGTLMLEYDVDRNTCEREVLAFIDELRQEGLIEVK